MLSDNKSYQNIVSFQKNNHEEKGRVKNQNEHFNIRKQALGPNGRRGK